MSKAGSSIESRPAAAAAKARPQPEGPALLHAAEISKVYQMGRVELRVLTDCDLSVAAGEFVAIMGKSGSGKSTLLHILGGLDVPQKGQVLFRGEPVFAPVGSRRFRASVTDVLSEHERRRNRLRRTHFGFVFQFYHLLPELTVLENVLLPRMIASSVLAWKREKPAAREAALRLLTDVGLAERVKHKPSELSGGERQRVAIARALVHKPAILFADEPTGNLDAESGRNILEILRRFRAAGQTIVLVTHDESVAATADRRLRLEAGRLQG